MGNRWADLRSKAAALAGLWRLEEDEVHAFLNTYGALFVDSPENTRTDHENGVPMQGYKQGSSRELELYYRVIHMLCTLGSVEKMYMPPTLDPARSVKANQVLLERQVAEDLAVGPGDRVLDLGCGCGAIAAHIQSLTGCEVFGINLDPSQIEKARRNPLLRKENFEVGDFNRPLPYPDASFDAVYNIQALTYASDMEFTFREVHRVLKPGGRFVNNDVAALDRYDRSDPRHRLLIQHTRELTAFGGFWYHKYWEDVYERTGFELLTSTGRSAAELVRKEIALYDKYEALTSLLSTLRLIPRKFFLMIQRMNANSLSYLAAEEEQLLSLNWYTAGRKPA